VIPASRMDQIAAYIVVTSGLPVTMCGLNVTVELAGTFTRGATVVDLRQVTVRPPNAQLAMSLDIGRFWDLIVAAAPGPSASQAELHALM